MSVSPVWDDIKHVIARNCALRMRFGISQLRLDRLRFEKKKKRGGGALKQTLLAHFVATRVSSSSISSSSSSDVVLNVGTNHEAW